MGNTVLETCPHMSNGSEKFHHLVDIGTSGQGTFFMSKKQEDTGSCKLGKNDHALLCIRFERLCSAPTEYRT